MSDWMEIVVPTTVDAADAVAALLADEVADARAGVEIRGDEVVFWTPMDDYESALARTRDAARKLSDDWGVAIAVADIIARPALPESEWRDAWKRHFHVTRVSRRIVIVPSWDTYQPAADDVVLHVDPGHAFGTGAHASTRLVLCLLDELHASGAAITRVLDVGAGSGILSIAAARLWLAGTCVAVDIDDMAVAATCDNCRRNRVHERITASTTPVADIDGAFDLVVANIQSSVLLQLVDDIRARVANGGDVMLSGLLTHQADAVAQAYADRGLTVIATRVSDRDPEWAAVHVRRTDCPTD